jgi:heme-degrading monooxygenase HmoA
MRTSSFALLPEPPYYTVIFSSQLKSDPAGYDSAAERMLELASIQAGFLGAESVRGTDGFGITVSYWSSLDAIAEWKKQAEHRIAQENGKQRWYEHYELRIALVERAHGKVSSGIA